LNEENDRTHLQKKTEEEKKKIEIEKTRRRKRRIFSTCLSSRYYSSFRTPMTYSAYPGA
jgi:hypothetical protein